MGRVEEGGGKEGGHQGRGGRDKESGSMAICWLNALRSMADAYHNGASLFSWASKHWFIKTIVCSSSSRWNAAFNCSIVVNCRQFIDSISPGVCVCVCMCVCVWDVVTHIGLEWPVEIATNQLQVAISSCRDVNEHRKRLIIACLLLRVARIIWTCGNENGIERSNQKAHYLTTRFDVNYNPKIVVL